MTDLTDWQLIEKCRVGRDEKAWDELVGRYERLVFYVPFRMYGLSEMDAADITQTVFSIMLKSFSTFHADSNVKSWLITVAKRHTWRHIERTKKEISFEAQDISESVVMNQVATVSEVAQWETVSWLNDGLMQLSERCRALLTALYLDEEPLSYDEIAVQFRMRKGSVGPTRARCLEKLREFLGEDVFWGGK